MRRSGHSRRTIFTCRVFLIREEANTAKRCGQAIRLAQGGVEPSTCCLGGSRSIQLSYWVVSQTQNPVGFEFGLAFRKKPQRVKSRSAFRTRFFKKKRRAGGLPLVIEGRQTGVRQGPHMAVWSLSDQLTIYQTPGRAVNTTSRSAQGRRRTLRKIRAPFPAVRNRDRSSRPAGHQPGRRRHLRASRKYSTPGCSPKTDGNGARR